MTADVNIRLLGEPGVTVDGSVRAATERVSMLLALLGSRLNSPVSSSFLTEAIWPEGSSRSTLHVLVARARKLFPEGSDVQLVTSPVGYKLMAPPDAIDVVRFERSVTTGLAAREEGRADEAERLLRVALDQWDTPFGLLGQHPALVAETTRLVELRATAEEELSSAILDLGRQNGDLERFQRLVDEEPLRERRWAQLMTALYRSGRQSEALRCAQRARTYLAEEIGVAPGPELVALETAILTHDASLAAPTIESSVVFRLPAVVTSFVGREREMDELRKLIDTNRLVTVWGPGGVGKSRTTLEVAREVAGSTRNGGVYVGMSSAVDLAEVLDLLALAIGVTRSDHHDLDNIVAHLADSECLVVLDNCEHLGFEVAALAEQLLSGCADVRVVVTSQRPLGILGETRWRLPLMSTSRDGGLSDAERLFHERALAEDRTHWKPDDVVALCEGLDGLPLALELAAALTPSLSPTEILSRLGDRFDLLAADHPTSPRHHRTLAATIDWSHSLLSDQAALLLSRVSVFEGGFTLDAAEAVCSGDGIDQEAVLGLVGELVSHSLLVSRPDRAGTRYQLLESILLFARRRLAEAGETERYVDRHLRHFAELARTLGRSVYLDDGDSVAVLATEQKNLRAALDHSIEVGEVDAALGLGNDLHGFWMFQGLSGYGRARLEQVLDPAAPVSVRTARAEMSAGIMAAFDSDYPSAEAHLDRAEQQFADLDIPKQLAWTSFWRGRAITAAVLAGSLPVESLEDAHRAHAAAIATFRATDDQISLLAAGPFAGLCGVLRRDPGGQELIERTLATATALDLRRHIALSSAMFALCLGQEGKYDESARLLAEATETLSAAGDRLNQSICEALHAQVVLAQGDLDLAARLARGHLALQQSHGAREWEPFLVAVAWAVLEARERELGRGDGLAEPLAGRLDLLLPNWTQPLALTAVCPVVDRPAHPYAQRAGSLAVSAFIDQLVGALEATMA